jgi:hypothetical protein
MNEPHQVNVIVDLQQNKSIPDGILLKAKRGILMLPSNVGKIAIVGGGSEVNANLKLFLQIYKQHNEQFVVADDITTAHILLRGKKPSPRSGLTGPLNSLRKSLIEEQSPLGY